MAVPPDVKQFLRRVWKNQQADGFVFLTWFDDDHMWHDRVFDLEGGRAKKLKLPNDGKDVYFAPNVFSTDKRQKKYARSGRWLYADLDEVDPRRLEYLLPTIAWETSPGRFQAMWKLKELLIPQDLAELNQKLTYFTDADKGGWSLTKVLRVPGTTSTKHGFDWPVRMMWNDGATYKASDVRRLVRDMPTPADVNGASGPIRIPKLTPTEVRKKYRGKLSASARKLLRAKEARGDRSAQLWKLYNLLLDAGLSPGEIFILAKVNVYNKYRGQQRENRQLWTEIHAAVARRPKEGDEDDEMEPDDDEIPEEIEDADGPMDEAFDAESNGRRKLISYDQFLSRQLPRPRWLVDSIWSEDAHGILAGPPKAYKSVISTDLAVSVASGTPFLDHFRVPRSGPVIMIQEENDPGEFQDRLKRISHAKALTGEAEYKHGSIELAETASLPISFLNNEGFDLTSKRDIRWLERECRRAGPVMVVLDPLYLMTPGRDENSASDMTPILKNLLRLKQRYGVGVLIIHHEHKQNSANPRGQIDRISGTGVFGRWFESALIAERPDPGETTVRLVPHHRAHAPQGVTYVTFDLGNDDDLHYSVDITRPRDERAEEHTKLAGLLDGEPHLEFQQLRKEMGIAADTLRRLLSDHGWVVVKAQGGRGRPKLIAKPVTEE